MSDSMQIPLTVTTPEEDPIILTDSAAAKVKDLMAREEGTELSLRVAVQPGGCSGLRYALFFDDRQLDGDVAKEVKGVPVRVDKMSAPHLVNTQIDWVDSLQGAGFSIDNPNAQSSCACGDSFS